MNQVLTDTEILYDITNSTLQLNPTNPEATFRRKAGPERKDYHRKECGAGFHRTDSKKKPLLGKQRGKFLGKQNRGVEF